MEQESNVTPIENKPIKKKRCCTYCKKEGHNCNQCDDPEMKEMIQGIKDRVEICDNRSDLFRFLTNGLTIKTLRIMSNHFQLQTNLKKTELVNNLMQPLIDGQIRQYINNYRKIEELMIEYPNKPLDEVITIIMLIKVYEQQSLTSVSDEIIEAVFNWLEGIYNGQSPDVQRQIYNGFSIALQHIRQVDDLSQNEQSRQWKVESLLLCLETHDELNKCKECPICLDEVKTIDILTTNCNHDFCGQCIMKHLDSTNSECAPNCPMCRTNIRQMEIKCPEIYQEFCEKYSN